MSDLTTSLYVFMLAAFIGFEVIRRVSPLLHTPLMSLTNALDAIAVVGAIILAGEGKSTMATVGGFLITDRMLGMFKAAARRGDHGHDPQRARDRADLPHRHGPVHPRAQMD